MIKILFILFMIIWGGNITLQAQILSKIKTVTKKVANEVSKEVISEIECAVFDQECIDKAKKEGKKVILVEEKEPGFGTGKQVTSENPGTVSDTPVSSSVALSDFYKNNSTITVCQISSPMAQVTTNDDLSFVAVADFIGSRRAYCVNGNMEEPYDRLGEFLFSPDGKHYAYSAYKDDKCYLILDGKVIDQTPGLGEFSQIHWNPNSSNLAYIKIPDKSQSEHTGQVVINGKASPTFESVSRIPFFLKDAKFYYAITENGETTLYSNHMVVGKNIGRLLWDNSTGNFVYTTADEKLVINGEQRSDYNTGGGYEMDRGTGAVMYEADSKKMIFWNDHLYEVPENERLLEIGENRFLANREANRFIFFTKNDFVRVYDNGKPSPPYQYVDNVQLSVDGSTLFYAAYNANKAFLVRNGQEIGPYAGIQELFISPSGKDYHYIAETSLAQGSHYRNGKNLNVSSIYDLFLAPDFSRYVLVMNTDYNIDGVKYEGKVDPPPVFSPDGKRLAYGVEDSSGKGLVIDGKKYPGETFHPSFSTFIFSPDSKHFAFTQRTSDQKIRLYIDMEPGPVFPSNPVLGFGPDNTLRAIIKGKDSLTKYEITLK